MNAAATKSTARQELTAKIEAKSTEELFAVLVELEKQTVGRYGTEEQKVVRAIIADTIEERHGLGAAMDIIFDQTFAGTYREALELAYVAAGN